MSRSLFESSKTALAFAAVTLVGAVSMVGTSDNRGMLPKLAERFGARTVVAPEPEPSAEESAEAAPPPEKKVVPGWYDTPQQAPTPSPVFSDIDPDARSLGTAPDPLAPVPSTTFPGTNPPSAAAPKPSGGPMNAPLSPSAIPVN